MLKEYEEKIDNLKENLIYAVEEHYEGELNISYAAKSSYDEIVLTQDEKIFETSNSTIADIVSQLIEYAEEYISQVESYDTRTLKRNYPVVQRFLDDICRTISILTVSIRINNAHWQKKLNDIANGNNNRKNTEMQKTTIEKSELNKLLDEALRIIKRGNKDKGEDLDGEE